MPQYRFSIAGDKWPTDYVVEGSNWATAGARAIREWRKKEGKGSRTTQLTIKGVKVNDFRQERPKF